MVFEINKRGLPLIDLGSIVEAIASDRQRAGFEATLQSQKEERDATQMQEMQKKLSLLLANLCYCASYHSDMEERREYVSV